MSKNKYPVEVDMLVASYSGAGYRPQIELDLESCQSLYFFTILYEDLNNSK